MDLCTHIENLIAPSLALRGYEIVRIQINGRIKKVLQIMIDHQDHDKQINVDDCEQVSRLVSQLLDAEDPIEGHYALEVSSPGLDRPLVKPEHFKRFIGAKVKVTSIELVEERKKHTGVLEAADDEGFSVLISSRANESVDFLVRFAYNEIKNAQLVIDI